MDDFRSRSYTYGDGSLQMEPYYRRDGPPPPPDFRSYSLAGYVGPKDAKLKKGNGGSKSLKGWSLSDPEFQRKKRVASYKVYAVEGKVKGSLRKSFKWIKDRYSQAMYGWW